MARYSSAVVSLFLIAMAELSVESEGRRIGRSVEGILIMRSVLMWILGLGRLAAPPVVARSSTSVLQARLGSQRNEKLTKLSAHLVGTAAAAAAVVMLGTFQAQAHTWITESNSGDCVATRQNGNGIYTPSDLYNRIVEDMRVIPKVVTRTNRKGEVTAVLMYLYSAGGARVRYEFFTTVADCQQQVRFDASYRLMELEQGLPANQP